jgi:hypothetical protein
VEITIGEFKMGEDGFSSKTFEKDLFPATSDAPVREVAAKNLRRLIIIKDRIKRLFRKLLISKSLK